MRVAALFRFPVKGFTREECESLEVLAGGRIAGDRVLGLRFNGATAADDAWGTKLEFVALVNYAWVGSSQAQIQSQRYFDCALSCRVKFWLMTYRMLLDADVSPQPSRNTFSALKRIRSLPVWTGFRCGWSGTGLRLATKIKSRGTRPCTDAPALRRSPLPLPKCPS